MAKAKRQDTVRLGFEVGTGMPIDIPVFHMAVTGMTQKSGKTTTLEALVSRSGVTAITFVTKRGEGAFASGRRVQPYFRDRADWQFVTALLDATLQEKNKFLRSWIIQLCRNTKTLAEVQAAVKKALFKATGINHGVYTQIDAYLELIVPEIKRAQLAKTLDLKPGLNVMDVSGFKTPMQMLFIQSAIDWVNEHCKNTVVVIPEAWEFCPQGKGSPVKGSAETLVRKGAGLGNFIWLDSQDMGGVEKEIVRGCQVWLIGVQREFNEIARNLKQIPATLKKPKAADIALLEKGQFFACFDREVVKVYVQPEWMAAGDATEVALGNTDARRVKPQAIIDRETVGDSYIVPETPSARNWESHPPRIEIDADAMAKAVAQAREEGVQQGRFEALQTALDTVSKSNSDLLLREIGNIRSAASSLFSAIDDAAEVARNLAKPSFTVELPAEPGPAKIIEPKQPTARVQLVAGSGELPPSAVKMLAILDTKPKVKYPWPRVALLAGLLPQGGSYHTAKKRMVDGGLVTEDGGLVSITTVSHGAGPANHTVEMLTAKMPPSARKMYEILCVGQALPWRHVAALAGLQPTGGSFHTAVRFLIDNVVVEENDGNAVVVPPNYFSGAHRRWTRDQIIGSWVNLLPSAAAGILGAVAAGTSLTHSAIAKILDVQPRGGSWHTAMKTLRDFKLIRDVDGMVSLAEDLSNV